MDIRTFPIIAFSLSDNTFAGPWYNGTAFLVDDIGHFYTAGHNFFLRKRGEEKPEKLKCVALINGDFFPIQEIFIEYDFDCEGTKKDFAHGKIINFKNLPDTKTIEFDKPIALGYSIRKLDFEIIETVKWDEKEFYLYKVPIAIGKNSKTMGVYVNISFDNVLFYTTESGVTLEGFSGGPILFNDKILGVLVSDCFIIREYIDKILFAGKSSYEIH